MGHFFGTDSKTGVSGKEPTITLSANSFTPFNCKRLISDSCKIALFLMLRKKIN